MGRYVVTFDRTLAQSAQVEIDAPSYAEAERIAEAGATRPEYTDSLKWSEGEQDGTVEVIDVEQVR